MAVDYARKKPKKRAPAKRKPKSVAKPRVGAVRNQPAQRISKIRAIIILIVVAAFIKGLVYLRVSNQKHPAEQAETVITEDQLPELPEERWSYIKELESKEVEVVVPERAASRPRLIQCASFRNKADAESMRAQIAFIGLEAEIRATQGEKGMWYRVILGPYENQRAAQKTTHTLQRGGVHNCQIWNWTD